MTASSRATTERKRPGGGRLRIRSIKLPAHADAVLAEQGPDDRDVARARVDQGVAHPEAAPHVALGIGEQMGGCNSTSWVSARQNR